MYSISQNKTRHQTFVHILTRYWPSFY